MDKEVTGLLTRLHQDDKQTLGSLVVFKGVDKVFECVTLELPYKGNARRISSIPTGVYECRLRWSVKYRWHYIVTDVIGRDYILIHFGNFHYQTKGCILAGNKYRDLDRDGYLDVTSSRKTMQKMLRLNINRFVLKIIEL